MSRISARQSALQKAEEILEAAWDARDGRARSAIALRALEVSPLCADAYVILASEAKPGSDRQLDLWRSGVKAGELAIGEDVFHECEGEFWGILETRPYMRARLGLALALWKRGGKSETIGHLRDLVRLNPNDNQGNRYILAEYCIEAGRDADAAALLKEYAEDETAFFEWTRALLAFRCRGDGESARKALARALKSNEHVPDYLVGAKKLPRRLPDYYGLGDTDEAVFYAKDFQKGWVMTPGAIEWLRTCVMKGLASSKLSKGAKK